MASSSSSAQRALEDLGNRLRELRRDAELTARDLARHCAWHESKVSKIEHGRQTPSDDDIRTWCRHTNADRHVTDLVATLHAVEGMYVEWPRMERSGLKVAQQVVVPLWERTKRFRIYSSWLVPGPLQTRGYIQAVLTSLRQHRVIPDDVEAAVQVRVDKQRVIAEGDRKFAVILEESVLRQPIGGAETMAGQLGYLLTVGSMPAVSLGIIPLDVDRSAIWPVEGFWMFDDEQVTVELVSGHLTVTQPYEIAMYAKSFAKLHDHAVYGTAARALITKAIEALDKQDRAHS